MLATDGGPIGSRHVRIVDIPPHKADNGVPACAAAAEVTLRAQRNTVRRGTIYLYGCMMVSAVVPGQQAVLQLDVKNASLVPITAVTYAVVRTRRLTDGDGESIYDRVVVGAGAFTMQGGVGDCGAKWLPMTIPKQSERMNLPCTFAVPKDITPSTMSALITVMYHVDVTVHALNTVQEPDLRIDIVVTKPLKGN